VASFVAPLRAAPPAAWRGSCPATPAHRLAAAIVHAGGDARWDETRFLRGETGAYLVVARRQGATWLVGAITALEERVLTVRCADFLPLTPPATYTLAIARDPLPGEPADADGVVREVFADVRPFDAPRIALPVGGGFLLRLEPTP
jgi:alpha-glucosidase